MEAHVLIRRTFRERDSVRLAIATEAAMEELASALGADVEAWALAGLVADLDREAQRENPARRGIAAADMLRTEQAPLDLVRAVVDRWAPDPPDALAAALAVASPASEAALRIDGRVERALLDGGARIHRALAHLELDATRASALCVAGIDRVRAEFGGPR